MRNKNFFLSILVFLLLASGLAVASVLVQRRQLVEKKAAGEKASLILAGPTSVGATQEFAVQVQLDTDGVEISGVDVVLEFPVDKLVLLEIQPEAQTTTTLKTFAPVNEDGSFNSTAVIEKANASGRIEFRAVSFGWETEGVTAPFAGILGPMNSLATLTFLVKPEASGQAVIRVVHTPGKTDDSNLVAAENGEDVLVKVSSLTMEISAGAGDLTPTLRPRPTKFVVPTLAPRLIPTATESGGLEK